VVVYYCIHYNIILGGKDLGLETLMIQLELEKKMKFEINLQGIKIVGIDQRTILE